jgi:hypothetical protein
MPPRGLACGSVELTALVTGESFAILDVFSAFGLASLAGHVDLDLYSGQGHNVRGTQKSLTLGFGLRLSLAGSFNYRRGISAGVYNGASPWNVMLSDVADEIDKAERRLADLKRSKQEIQKKIEAGEPFPERWLAFAYTQT